MATRRRRRPRTKSPAERYAAALSGLDRQDPTAGDRYSAAAAVLGAPSGQQGRTIDQPDKSLLDRLKDVGTGALDALSVPGAIVTTSLTNIIQGLKGDPGVSWKNLAGTFRGEKFAGGAGLLRALGVDSENAQRWGGLGIDIITDPTWLLSVVPGVGPAKAGAAAQRFNRLKRINELGREAEDVVRGGRLFITNPRRAARDDSLQGRLLDPEINARLQGLRAAAAQERYNMRIEGFIPTLRVGLFSKRVAPSGQRVRRGEEGFEDAIKVPRGIQIPLARNPKFKRDPRKGNWFRMSPLAALFHETNAAARSLTEFQDKAIRELRDLHELDEADGALLASHVHLKNANEAAAAAQREDMIARGTWKDSYDEVVQQHDELMRRQANALGLKDWEEQVAAFRAFQASPDPNAERLAARQAELMGKLNERFRARQEEALRPVQAHRDEIRRVEESVQTAQRMHETAVRDAQRARAKYNLLVRQKDRITKTIKVRKGQRHRSNYTKYMNRQIRAAQAEMQRTERLVQTTRRAFERATASSGRLKVLRAKLVEAQRDAVRGVVAAADEHRKAVQALNDAFRAQSAKVESARHGEFIKYAKDNNLSAFLQKVKTTKRGNVKPVVGKAGNLARYRTMDEMEQLAADLAQRGGYAHRTLSDETLEALRTWRTEQYLAGKITPEIMGDLRNARDMPDVLKRRHYESTAQLLTREQFIEQLTKRGVDPAEAAQQADEWARVMQFAKEPQMYPQTDVVLTPELNIFTMMSRREAAQATALVKQQMIRMLDEAFPGRTLKEAELEFKELIKTYRTTGVPYSMTKALGTIRKGPNRGDSRIQVGMAYLKAYFTVLNPGHYFTNAYGSFVNSLINGSGQHLMRGAAGSLGLPKHGRDLGKMTNKDAIYKIGPREYSGAELMVLGRLSGLGLGFSGEEVETLLRIHNSGRKRDFLARVATNLNMNRENADRMWAWMNHMRAGADPFTAAASVLRYAFDYSAATHWERVWGRNLILFYTWFKNNLEYQGYGLLTRPAMYSTLNHLENSRPKWDNEPEYWQRMGGLWTPWGLLTFGNPMADIFKYEVSLDNFRRNLLGATNPLVRVPVELGTNRSFWLGGDIKKFEGQDSPNFIARLQNALGIPGTTMTRANAEGERQPGHDAYFSYLLSQFLGPQGNLATHITNPDDSTSDTMKLSRLLGFRVWPREQDKWDRAAKYLQARRKADRTRERSYERP